MALLGVAALLTLATPQRPVISFWNGIGSAQVFVMATDGTGVRQLTHLFSAKRASWSPDGKRLAFDGRFYKTLNDFDIGIMRADGSGVRRITRGPERDVMAVWSPDGRWIAFDAAGGIWAVRPDGSGRHVIARGNIGGLEWSPDGRRIAYTSWSGKAPEVYVARADGSGARRLTRNRVDDFDPSWSPDGRKILYTHGRENAHAVYVMNSDGSRKRRLTRGGDDWATSWRR